MSVLCTLSRVVCVRLFSRSDDWRQNLAIIQPQWSLINDLTASLCAETSHFECHELTYFAVGGIGIMTSSEAT